MEDPGVVAVEDWVVDVLRDVEVGPVEVLVPLEVVEDVERLVDVEDVVPLDELEVVVPDVVPVVELVELLLVLDVVVELVLLVVVVEEAGAVNSRTRLLPESASQTSPEPSATRPEGDARLACPVPAAPSPKPGCPRTVEALSPVANG